MGLGLNIMSDKRGVSNRFVANVSYSYRVKLSNNAYILFGVSLGVVNQTFDFSNIIVETNTDPNLYLGSQKKASYDGNAGLAFVWKFLELGLSVPQIAGNKIKFNIDSSKKNIYTQERQYVSFAKCKFYLDKGKLFSIIPQTIIRISSNSPIQFDGTINIDWQDKFWVGATYKNNYALAAIAGFCVKKHLYVGYSYDFIIGNLSSYAGTSHEIMLNYKFGKNKREVFNSENKKKINIDEKAGNNYINEKQELVQKNEITKDTTNDVQKISDLTTLIVANLLKEIETVLDNANTTQAEIQSLKNKIAEFSNSAFPDATMKDKVSQYTTKLKLTSKNTRDIFVKGSVILEGISKANYSLVTITLKDKKTNQIIGTYKPNAKTGKYILILRPKEKYQLIVEHEDYNIYIQDIVYPVTSKEVIQKIKLKK
jgi:type IX secretion system PorP/SprF family membrane protein